jgi:muramoyltetrapeptide carboxypeptidase
VRVVAPSSPFDLAEFEAGLDVLRSWGFEPRFRQDIHDRRAYLAGTPERRAAELHEAFEDSEAKAIFCVRGGYGLTTVLPLLDPQQIARHPKPVIGCSDVTVLLNWLVQSAGMTSVHGPMVAALGRGDAPGGERLKALLTRSVKPAELRSSMDDAGSWCIAPGVARGIALGGSLSMLAALCGTPWQLDTAGAVLFLEDIGERPYRVDRLLTQLASAGFFDQVAGVVFGDMVGCDDGAEGGEPLSWRHAASRIFRSRSIPVLAGLSFGHSVPNLAIPLGVEVELDAGAGWLKFRGAPLA